MVDSLPVRNKLTAKNDKDCTFCPVFHHVPSRLLDNYTDFVSKSYRKHRSILILLHVYSVPV